MILISFIQVLLIVTEINYLSFLSLTFICHTLFYLSVPFNAKLILLFYINVQKLLRFKQNIAYCGIWEPQTRAINWYIKSTLNKIYTSN